MGKGEIVGYQHFLLFPHCFRRLILWGHLTSELSGKELTLYHTISTLNDPGKEAFSTHCGKIRKCW